MDVPYFIKEHHWMNANTQNVLVEVKTLLKVDFENKVVSQLQLLWWLSKLWTNEEGHYR